MTDNCIGDVINGYRACNCGTRVFDPQSGQTKDNKLVFVASPIGIMCRCEATLPGLVVV